MPQEPPPQQGPGTHTFVDGSYTGEFQAGKRHGQGKMIYLADSSYEGAWAKDKKHGYGVLSSASGNGYTGDYHYDKMQGNGIQTWSDGRRYEGVFKNNEKGGRGVYTFSNGCRFEGEFDRGKYVHGIMTESNGSQYTGNFKDGKFGGEGAYQWPHSVANAPRYEGAFADGRMHGDGVLRWSNGDQFTGSFVRGCPQKGVLERPDSSNQVLTFPTPSDADLQFATFMSSATLPSVTPDMCKEIGNISGALWAAIKDGRHESYARLAQGLLLADRILVKKFHVAENATGAVQMGDPAQRRQRQAMKITFDGGGAEGAAAEQILRSLIDNERTSPHLHFGNGIVDNIAAKVHWAIEVEVKAPQHKAPTKKVTLTGAPAHPIDSSGVLEAIKMGNFIKFHELLKSQTHLSFVDFNSLPPRRKFGVVHQIAYHGDQHLVDGEPSRAALEALLIAHPRVDLKLLTQDGMTADQVAVEQNAHASFLDLLRNRVQQQEKEEKEEKERQALVSTGSESEMQEEEIIEDDKDEDNLQKMFRIGVQGFPDLDIKGSNPFVTTRSGAVQADPLALMHIADLRPWYVAAGRFVGSALWTSKTIGLPLARFFARRVLELARTERVVAFSSDGDGPPLVRQHWQQVKQWGQERTFNGTFVLPAGARAICGQPCRVSKPLPVPVFKASDDDEHKGKSLEDLALAKEEEDAKTARRLMEAQDEAYAQALQQGRNVADCDTIAQAAVQKVLADIEAEKKGKASSGAPSQDSPLLASDHPQALLLGSNVFSFKMPVGSPALGYAFLPAWVMQALKVKDGDEVSVEALPLPLDKAGHAMTTWSPELGCGLPLATRVCWRLPNHNLVGDAEHLPDSHMQSADLADFFAKQNFSCVKKDVAIPIKWSGSTVFINAENIVDGDDTRALGEAVIAAHTEHVVLPPLVAPLAPVRGEADGQPKSRWRMVFSAIKAASLLGSTTDEALMTSEMLLDYLEQAARDEIDRDHIKRNEFGWLLKHKIAGLDEDGTLPPRFSGLAGGGMKRTITRVVQPNKRRKDETGGAGGTSSSSSAAVASSGVSKEYYSTLAQAPENAAEAAELSEKAKRDLLRRWLRRKLYEEVQEQAYAFSRGLREIVPLGVLELFSVEELQAMLGAGPAVKNAALADWKRHTEYFNGLDASSERVKWFWEAVASMSPAARANVWRYATGRTIPPLPSEGGCGALEPKFNLVDRGSSEEEDQALITAATCHRQLRLPKYSSAEATSRQLALSVEQGLASTEDAESFEAVQRRLMAKVQEEMTKHAGSGKEEQETKAMLRALFPNSYMCGKCNFGPVDHHHCADLRAHHGQALPGAKISNACPKCGWFSAAISDWPTWDGRVW